jgi:hypothetical protein
MLENESNLRAFIERRNLSWARLVSAILMALSFGKIWSFI